MKNYWPALRIGGLLLVGAALLPLAGGRAGSEDCEPVRGSGDVGVASGSRSARAADHGAGRSEAAAGS